ncbi:Neurotransmitter-gated ion-channel ligand binding domain protein [Teladorsagia circumcincta]|uniref:Neurotransmitter-gated ion-channel ligand binding domain protein n=1 Tax=Teladorsagia circumcincta TaxID=45464 RepID=A0A2G9UVR7_TELCI|nr:Neurotransmitter-gated ion-channel ligand binding domain protein [Teladorsagia circumcincta]
MLAATLRGPLVEFARCAPPDGVVVITHEMELVHIHTVDELKQTMIVLVYVVEEWDDPTLSWDPTNFSGLRVTWLPEEAIWVPDIIVFNMLNHQELLHSVRSPIRVQYTGRVTFSYPAIYSVMCQIVVYFHFNIIMVTVATILTSIVMRVHSKGFSSHLLPPPKWLLRYLFIGQPEFGPACTNAGSNFANWKRQVITEQWAEVSRRMDYAMAFAFLISVTTPTVYLFLICFSTDDTAQEKALLAESRESAHRF